MAETEYMDRLPNIRFHPKRDWDLIEWVESISHLPNGLKGEAVKDVLRSGLLKGASSRPKEATPRTILPSQTQTHLAQLDIPSLIEALRNEFLADIRAIVDASIAQSFEGMTIGKEQAPLESNEETDDILDSFADLMLE